MLSAPHSQTTFRESEEKDREKRTGVIAKMLNDFTGVPVIYKNYKSDDPNFYDLIPDSSLTSVFTDSIGTLIPFKKKIRDEINNNENLKLLIDLHGFEDLNARDGFIDIGDMNGESLESQVGSCIPEIFSYIFNKYNITTTNNFYSASQNNTNVKFVSNNIDRTFDAIQLEIEDVHRECESFRYSILMYALIESILITDYLYGNNQ